MLEGVEKNNVSSSFVQAGAKELTLNLTTAIDAWFPTLISTDANRYGNLIS